MTGHVSVCKQAAMLAQVGGTVENIDDLESLYLIANGATSAQVNDQWMEIFQLNGASSDNWNVAANQALIALGAPFLNLQDNWHWFWCVNNGSILGLKWAAAGSRYMFTGDGNDESDHELVAQYIGAGSPSFSVPDGLPLPDFENIYRLLDAVDLPPWYGSRVVENIFLFSNDFDNASWEVSDAAQKVGFDPVAEGYEITLDTGQFFRERVGAFASNSPLIQRWEIRAKTGTATFKFRFGTNANSSPEITATETWQILSAALTANQVGGSASLGLQYSGTGIQTLYVRKAQVEDATGRADTVNPSVYVPTTSVAATKKYSNLNGNTIDGNDVVVPGVGAPLAVLPSLYAAPAALNDQIYSNDVTQWTLTGATASFDQPGLTGAPNTASLLSGTGADVAEPPSVTIPVDNNPVTVKTYIGKLGSGNAISIKTPWVGGTQLTTVNLIGGTISSSGADASEIRDGGSHWVVILQYNNNGSRNAIQQTIEPNNAGGIVVMNDEVYVGKTIAEVRWLAPIFTSGTAGGTAQIFLPYLDQNHSDTGGAYYCEFTNLGINTGGWALFTGSIQGQIIYGATATEFRSFDGTSVLVSTPVVLDADGKVYKVGMVYGEGKREFNVDGVVGSEGAYDGSFAIDGRNAINVIVGHSSPFNLPGVMLIRNVRRYGDDTYAANKAHVADLMPDSATYNPLETSPDWSVIDNAPSGMVLTAGMINLPSSKLPNSLVTMDGSTFTDGIAQCYIETLNAGTGKASFVLAARATDSDNFAVAVRSYQGVIAASKRVGNVLTAMTFVEGTLPNPPAGTLIQIILEGTVGKVRVGNTIYTIDESIPMSAGAAGAVARGTDAAHDLAFGYSFINND